MTGLHALRDCLKYAILWLHRLLKSTENHCVTSRMRKPIEAQPVLVDLSVELRVINNNLFSQGWTFFGPDYVPSRKSTAN